MKRYGSIYIITNQINGKKYVGITTKTVSDRFNAHYNRATKTRSAIQKALHKYGKDNFKVEEVYTSFTKDDLYSMEIVFIKTLDTFKGYGYNLTEGGGGITDMSADIRKKISNSKKGKTIPKLKGRDISKKQRIQISKTLGGSKVKCVNTITNEVFYLDYATQGKDYGFNPSLICAVIKGKRKHHKNHIFEYVN